MNYSKKTEKTTGKVLVGLGIDMPTQTKAKRVKGKIVTGQVENNKKELSRMVREAVY